MPSDHARTQTTAPPKKGETWMSSTKPGTGLRVLYDARTLVLFDRIPGPGWSGMTLPGFRKWVRVHQAVMVAP